MGVSAGLAEVSRASRWPLVGRAGELADFHGALDDPFRGGMLICGPAGVGKTRLAEEFLALAGSAGRVYGRATATATAAQVPLGALGHLLPPGVGRDRCDAVALFDGVAGGFRAAGRDPFVLLADDLHLLDRTSLTLLTQLVDARVVFLIGTVRTGELVPDAMSALWRDDRILRIDLDELSAAEVDQLLCAALGGPVETSTAADVFAIGRGNPLFVRELILGAVRSGHLVAERGVWRLTGPLLSTTALAELVRAHLAMVGPAERSVLNLLAMVGPVGLAEFAGPTPEEALERLERAGLVTILADGRRLQVVLAHPLYADVLRGRLPVLTRRRLLLEHADRVERAGARRPGDPLRVATWRLDAAGTADPELLLVAARLARYGHDFPAVERLSRAALVQRESVECRLLLGEALYELGRFAQSELELAAAQDDADDEGDLVAIVATRVRNLTWGLLEPDRALRVSRAARAAVRDREAGHELLAVEARVQVYSGNPADTLTTLTPLTGVADPRIAVLAAPPRALALVLLGRCETGLAVARRGLADHTRLGQALAMIHPSAHLAIEVHALTEAGRLTEAAAAAERGRALAARDRSTIGRIWFAYHLGRTALLTGRPATAHRWYAEATTLCRDHDYPWPRRLLLSALATACAVRGDPAAARRALAEADTVGDIGYLCHEQELGRIWTAAADGDLTTARRLLCAAAQNAAASGHHSSEAWLWHDLVRLGDPDPARARLAELADQGESELVRSYAAHADAAATDDPDRLSATADHFERLGAHLYAAEAAFAAGRAYRRHGRPRHAARADHHAAALATNCEDARTAGLLQPSAEVPLTQRESEIATLAAGGATSKQIASILHLSARTVDNHLQRTYTKLGVTRRTQLATALNSSKIAAWVGLETPG
jgi:DNA-binding NarL/FixJ family response regulator